MRREFEFKSGGEVVRGRLYLPGEDDSLLPAVVMSRGRRHPQELAQ